MKKPILLALAAFVAFSPAAWGAAEHYQLDPKHTTVTWKAGHFSFSSPSGKFMKVTGDVRLDEDAPEKSAVDVTIRTDSLMTGLEDFDTHLKSADFLDVEQFPTAHFESTNVDLTGDETAKVYGTLSLHGIAKPVVLDVRLNKVGIQPMTKKKTAGFTATTTLKRSDFGIVYALPDISDEVQIEIEAEAMRVEGAE